MRPCAPRELDHSVHVHEIVLVDDVATAPFAARVSAPVSLDPPTGEAIGRRRRARLLRARRGRLRGMRPSVTCVATVALLAGCEHPSAPQSLIVDLRTDLVVGVEVDRFTIAIDGAPVSSGRLNATGDYIEGARLGELEPPRGARADLELELRDGGAVVARRRILVRLRGLTAVLFVVGRGCRDVTCDAPRSCLANRCLDPACLTGTEAACPEPACSTDAECPTAASCAEPRCRDGVCFAEGIDERCGPTQYCDPGAGCAVRPGAAPDAGFDAGFDAGPSFPPFAIRATANNHYVVALGTETELIWASPIERNFRAGEITQCSGWEEWTSTPTPRATHLYFLVAGDSDGHTSGALVVRRDGVVTGGTTTSWAGCRLGAAIPDDYEAFVADALTRCSWSIDASVGWDGGNACGFTPAPSWIWWPNLIPSNEHVLFRRPLAEL